MKTKGMDVKQGQAEEINHVIKIRNTEYRLIREIGVGGQATVYYAQRMEDGKVVAIKIFNSSEKYFQSELKVLQNMSHANIARVLDFGNCKLPLLRQSDCLVMEYIDGLPLDEYCKGQSPEVIIGLMVEIAHTIEYAHRGVGQDKIIHRDLKCRNIMVDKSGSPAFWIWSGQIDLRRSNQHKSFRERAWYTLLYGAGADP